MFTNQIGTGSTYSNSNSSLINNTNASSTVQVAVAEQNLSAQTTSRSGVVPETSLKSRKVSSLSESGNFQKTVILATDEDIKFAINRVKDFRMEEDLNNIETIIFKCVNTRNLDNAEELLRLLAEKSDKLINFSSLFFETLGECVYLKISKFPENIELLSFNEKSDDVTIELEEFPIKLKTFGLEDLGENTILILPERFPSSVQHFFVGEIGENEEAREVIKKLEETMSYIQ